MTAAESLAHDADQLSVTLSGSQAEALLAYLALLSKWGRVYNLTAVLRPEEMLVQHILDSLAVLQPLARQISTLLPATLPLAIPGRLQLLDVGSGAGLPGVVIAICRPDMDVTCVDTVAKKAAFIQQVAVSLKLPNLRAVHARVENLDTRYDVISARAFASLADFTAWSFTALQPMGFWMAMKGKMPTQEMADLPAQVEVFHVEQLTVPRMDASRCIVWMRPKAA
ncbi:MAG: 16S rRNA (guanine(527)-N(7))-methyltransferase RsmG [Ramlibacter sp.]